LATIFSFASGIFLRAGNGCIARLCFGCDDVLEVFIEKQESIFK
jgi:hypothetical protein